MFFNEKIKLFLTTYLMCMCMLGVMLLFSVLGENKNCICNTLFIDFFLNK